MLAEGVKAAKVEGVRAQWKAQPVAFEGQDQVTGLQCVRYDDQAQAIAGSEFNIQADLVLLAIGQSKQETLLSQLDGLTLKWGRVVVDDQGATTRLGYFAGGDCANGGKEVVNAASEGKKAAQAINQYLNQGQSLRG